MRITQSNAGEHKGTERNRGTGDISGHRGHLGTVGTVGKVIKIVVCVCNFCKNVWVKNKDTILFTNQLG